MVGFIFDAKKGETPASIARQREIVEAMLAARGTPRNVPEGLNALGDGIVANVLGRRADRAETAGREGAAGSIAAIMSAFGGGGGSPSPSAGASTGEPGNLDSYLSSIRAAESGGNDAAKNPLSSATGRYQFTSGTWADVGRAHPELGLTPEGRLDPEQQEKAIRAFTQDNAGILNKAGIPITGGSLYGAHFLGSGGASKVYGADPGASVAEIVGPEVVRANPFLRGMSVGDFQQWAAKKGGGGAIAFDGSPAPTHPDPIQVASLDPSAGVAQATAQPGRPMPEEYAKTGLSPDAWARMNAPDAPPAQQQAPAAPAQQQIAQVLNSGPTPQGGQSSGPTVEMLMQAAQNPWLSEGQRGIVNMLLQKEMQKNDPAYQMGIEKDRLELDALRNPRISPADQARLDMDREKLGFEQKDSATDNQREAAKLKLEQDKYANDSTLAREKFDWEKDKDRLPEFYDAYVKQERDAGREPLGILDYVTTSKKAGATNVTTTVGEGDKFYENLDKKNAETFSALSDEGVRGNAKLAQIDRLEGLLATAPQGAGAMLKQAAGEYGINTEGLSEIQAAQALINELVPQQRQPGSGPMSDADLALFKQSLPRLINQPGGNQTIIDTMRGITQYQIQMGQIADKVADRDMTPKEAREAIRALPNPLANFGKKKATPSAPKQPAVIDGYTIEQVDD